jgi:hypothetical protein
VPAAAAVDFERLAEQISAGGLNDENVAELGAALAHSFGVRHDEVGILRVQGTTLEFVYPLKLRNIAIIPLNSTGSVAAQTVNTDKPQIINNFSQVRHTTFFEAVNLRGDGKNRPEQVIQKMMSAPIPGGKSPAGVIQVSRKGASPTQAGKDFTFADLQKLMSKAKVLSKLLAK